MSLATSVSFAPWVTHDPDAADKHEHCFVETMDDEEFVLRSMKEIQLTNRQFGGRDADIGSQETQGGIDTLGLTTGASEIVGSIAETFGPTNVIHSLAERVEGVGKAVGTVVGNAFGGVIKSVGGNKDCHTVELRGGDVREETGKDAAKMAS